MKRLAPFIILPLLALPALAVESHNGAGNVHQPYAALAERAIKALSPEETDALLTGKGFSQALAAELNGFPGPLHVLDFRDGLSLTASQERAVQTLFDEMQGEATALGRDIIAAETALDTAFASATIDEAALADLTATIARLRGTLRATHLKYHLRTKAVLSRHQVMTYNRLRGYGGGHQGGHMPD